MRLKHLYFLEEDGDRSEAAMHVLFPLLSPLLGLKLSLGKL